MEGQIVLLNQRIEAHLEKCEEYEGEECICDQIKEEIYWNSINNQIDDILLGGQYER
jgi:hypothetical protein